MAELMIAVVILGIGLLITSSMFPIAWFKAREVAEGAIVPALTDTAEFTVKEVTHPARVHLNRYYPLYLSSFFPGDWVPLAIPAPDMQLEQAFVYPDTRVHCLDMGNYLVERDINDFDDSSGDPVPVGDDTWMIEDNIDIMLGNRSPLLSGFLPPAPSEFVDVMRPALKPQVRAHSRLSQALEPRQADAAKPQVLALWKERFELRRHCWSVFYKFNRLPGLDYAAAAKDLNGDGRDFDGADNRRRFELADVAMKQPKQLSMYYVTLKRPAGARYARQKGFDPEVGGSKPADLTDPEPRDAQYDVCLPVPWRFEASLTKLPSEVSVVGLNSEIAIPATMVNIANFLDDGYVIIDDRTGRVFTVTARRDGEYEGVASVICTLDGGYSQAEIEDVADYEPRLSTSTVPNNDRQRHNWEYAGIWKMNGCDEDPSRCAAFMKEDEPEKRTYWVFPPPVDAQRGLNNTLLYDGSPPVVGIEIRQLTL